MPQQRPRKQQTPINSDAFNLTPDWATTADTSGVLTSVADRTEAETIATALTTAGWPPSDARPLYVFNLATNSIEVKITAGWKGGIKPFGHMGRTAGFLGVVTGGTLVPMDAAQLLRGGMTFSNADDALVLPITGQYRVTVRVYLTDQTGWWGYGRAHKNGATEISGSFVSLWKGDSSDFTTSHSVVFSGAAGDKISLVAGGNNALSKTWGTNGYDGSWLEVEYLDQW